ncbi:uncharacterized protein LOC126322383 [Schistocerca gregaria]|uniref:uncharacterized protein LOC126322383 n=1 Tax=Schistocerca gregaria TaxID=7010 RepID=UPI00211DD94C|nr:uncharacterized protein LOC126322383 [Schistocerca gregaria]
MSSAYATQYLKPDNALKRAEELISLGYKQKALELLHPVILSPRCRSWTKPIETLIIRFLGLCVELRQSELAKEALYQFKNTSSSVPNSMEVVVKFYLQKAKNAAHEAQMKAASIGASNVMNQESEAMDDLTDQLLQVSGEDSKERSERMLDRGIVMPWLRFLWDAYRSVLDALYRNSRLEHVYKSTAEQAYAFCLENGRISEFRSLNDHLRLHMNSHQSHLLDIFESFQMLLEIRFIQLDTAIKLELWQEAFRTVEDIEAMMRESKHEPPIGLLVILFEKITQIFWMSENYTFHAHSINKYYRLYLEMKNKYRQGQQGTGGNLDEQAKKILESTDEMVLASKALLANLSMPIQSYTSVQPRYLAEMEHQNVPFSVIMHRETKMKTSWEAQNLGLRSLDIDLLLSNGPSNPPGGTTSMFWQHGAEIDMTSEKMHRFLNLLDAVNLDREAVLQEYMGRVDLSKEVYPELANAYQLLEVEFIRLPLIEQISNLLKFIEKTKPLQQYSKTMSQLAFLRILQNLSRVYHTLRLSNLKKWIPFVPESELERWIIRAIQNRHIEGMLNHSRDLITFENALETTSLNNQVFCWQLMKAVRQMNEAAEIYTVPMEDKEAQLREKKALFTEMAKQLEKEREELLARPQIIETATIEREQQLEEGQQHQKKLAQEQLQKQRKEELERQQAKMAAAEAKKDAQKKAEMERQQKLSILAKFEEQAQKKGAKLSDALNKKLESGMVDMETFITGQAKVIVSEYNRLEKRLKDLNERLDHLARARKNCEIPLIKKIQAQRVERDMMYREEKLKVFRKSHEDAYKMWMEEKKRLEKTQEERRKLEERVLKQKREAFEQAMREEKERKELAMKAERQQNQEKINEIERWDQNRQMSGDYQKRMQDSRMSRGTEMWPQDGRVSRADERLPKESRMPRYDEAMRAKGTKVPGDDEQRVQDSKMSRSDERWVQDVRPVPSNAEKISQAAGLATASAVNVQKAAAQEAESAAVPGISKVEKKETVSPSAPEAEKAPQKTGDVTATSEVGKVSWGGEPPTPKDREKSLPQPKSASDAERAAQDARMSRSNEPYKQNVKSPISAEGRWVQNERPPISEGRRLQNERPPEERWVQHERPPISEGRRPQSDRPPIHEERWVQHERPPISEGRRPQSDRPPIHEERWVQHERPPISEGRRPQSDRPPIHEERWVQHERPPISEGRRPQSDRPPIHEERWVQHERPPISEGRRPQSDRPPIHEERWVQHDRPPISEGRRPQSDRPPIHEERWVQHDRPPVNEGRLPQDEWSSSGMRRRMPGSRKFGSSNFGPPGSRNAFSTMSRNESGYGKDRYGSEYGRDRYPGGGYNRPGADSDNWREDRSTNRPPPRSQQAQQQPQPQLPPSSGAKSYRDSIVSEKKVDSPGEQRTESTRVNKAQN